MPVFVFTGTDFLYRGKWNPKSGAGLAKRYGDRLEIFEQGSGCAFALRGSNPLPGAVLNYLDRYP